MKLTQKNAQAFVRKYHPRAVCRSYAGSYLVHLAGGTAGEMWAWDGKSSGQAWKAAAERVIKTLENAIVTDGFAASATETTSKDPS